MAAMPRRCAPTVCCGALLIALTAPIAHADGPKPTDLRLSRVVLFTSGVGFFEHQGDVTGNARVDLRFDVSDINDLLKSMVLEDRGGGQVSRVAYDSRDPLVKALGTFSVDLTSEPSLSELLRQLRGEQIRVETLTQGAETPITGQILGVERRLQKVGKDESQGVDYLNLLTPAGVRTVSLENVNSFALVNEKLNKEMQAALVLIAQRRGNEKKNVSISFSGDKNRAVRVGYILEAPQWKTSYRLVLKDDGPPLLQGWAIVENTTENDWQDVQLTLVSGRPISFTMDLYEPQYVARLAVGPNVLGAPRPQLHGQDLADANAQLRRARTGTAFTGGFGGMGGMMGGMGGMSGGDGAFGGGGQPAAEKKEVSGPIDPGAGVRSAAETAEVGELFRYQIAQPVSILRQQSAMLPVVNDSIKAEKVSLYNPAVQAKHPLSAIRLTNSTTLHLMQGPITVFDGGEYAGDARIEDLAPGGRRLISYALDLDTEIVPDAKSTTDKIVSANLVDGVLEVSHCERRSQSYIVKNSGGRPKKVLMEQPIDAAWKLASPKAAEQTRNLYRFAVTAAPGKSETLTVDEERLVGEKVSLSTAVTDETLAVYLEAPAINDSIKRALRDIQDRRAKLGELSAERTQLQEKLRAFDAEQSRIRQNMAQLDRTSDLYKRYVNKFNEQEDQVEQMRPRLEEVVASEAKADLELKSFIRNLKLLDAR